MMAVISVLSNQRKQSRSKFVNILRVYRSLCFNIILIVNEIAVSAFPELFTKVLRLSTLQISRLNCVDIISNGSSRYHECFEYSAIWWPIPSLLINEFVLDSQIPL